MLATCAPDPAVSFAFDYICMTSRTLTQAYTHNVTICKNKHTHTRQLWNLKRNCKTEATNHKLNLCSDSNINIKCIQYFLNVQYEYWLYY